MLTLPSIPIISWFTATRPTATDHARGLSTPSNRYQTPLHLKSREDDDSAMAYAEIIDMYSSPEGDEENFSRNVPFKEVTKLNLLANPFCPRNQISKFPPPESPPPIPPRISPLLSPSINRSNLAKTDVTSSIDRPRRAMEVLRFFDNNPNLVTEEVKSTQPPKYSDEGSSRYIPTDPEQRKAWYSLHGEPDQQTKMSFEDFISTNLTAVSLCSYANQ